MEYNLKSRGKLGAFNVVIEGNTISNTFNTLAGSGSNGIFLDNTENVIIRNNTIDAAAASGILVGGSTSGVSGCVNTTVQGNTVSSSGQDGIDVVFATNTMLQDNICNYNGQDCSSCDGIFVLESTNTSLIGNSSIGNANAGINIVGGSTDTFVQNNTTTQNGVFGIIDGDNTGEVTAFFNKSCDNGVANCVDIPLQQAPGDTTYIAGANLCCLDPALAGAKKANANAKDDQKGFPEEPAKASDDSEVGGL